VIGLAETVLDTVATVALLAPTLLQTMLPD
jgi:hypothetical protein